jgi:hypothetical protein
MNRISAIVSLLLVFMVVSNSFPKENETPLRIFGYFQNSLQHWTDSEDSPDKNFFNLQQLNIFLQKNLSLNWTAFVNFEVLNNFSSSRQWGALNLEEAWIKYRSSMKFNLKLGLQIPIFNNLNEIKNRTPLLPYIIRPLVYETSFNELIAIENFVPARAFVQAYGFLPYGETKFEYAAYIGNSRNINVNSNRGQTGIDTTTTFLLGGRLGIRHQELKLGLSATHEKINEFMDIAPDIGRQPSELQERPMTRLGGDLSYNFGNVFFESEFITVNVDEGIPEVELDLDFYYATLGYHFTEELFGYGSYWVMDAHVTLLFPGAELIEDDDIEVGTIGISYDLYDRLRLKAQYALVTNHERRHYISRDVVEKEQEKFNVWALAVSVYF